MKYLKNFLNGVDYHNYKNSSSYVTPNVSYIEESDTVIYNTFAFSCLAGDIAYFSNKTGAIETIAFDKYNYDLGEAIGVVVIPTGMLPDGRARIVGFAYMTENGNYADSPADVRWIKTIFNGTDLPKFGAVPTTDNKGSSTVGWNLVGYLPSDNFSGIQSYTDPQSKYVSSVPFIPSPYSGDSKTLNTQYNAYNLNANALSDFSGKETTDQIKYIFQSDSIAANAATSYHDIADLSWYLPSIGELGIMMARLNTINTSINYIDYGAIINNTTLWSSTSVSDILAFYLNTENGQISQKNKTTQCAVRPFAMI